MCPLYMYYEGDLYIPAVNPEDRLIFDTAELKDYKYVGKTTQCSDCSGLTENFRVFTVSLMTSAPAWISENIYIRCPKGKTFVYIPVITL